MQRTSSSTSTIENRAPRRSPVVGWTSVTGRRRSVNEDAVLTGPAWYAVADGLGGHRAGEVASTLVVDVLAGFATVGTATDPDIIEAVIERAITRASNIVHRAATGPRSGMGTTVVGAVVLDDGSTTVFHVGDSRCYRFHGGALSLLTTDHTHVQELVDTGHLTRDRAHTHPLRNVLTRAIGTRPDVSADLRRVGAPTGRLLLCSDGVWAHLEPSVIERILDVVGDPQHAADELVGSAIESGSPDDASAIVIDTCPDLVPLPVVG
ncbi:MAG: PP2C family protein-serine/threonine phosphatase [Ilumatobacteraceae bacterium]